MKHVLAFLALALSLLTLAVAQKRRTGSPPTYNGRPCASTTYYSDGTMGACGCGYQSSNTAFSWMDSGYTAAGSQLLFDSGGATWCGAGCGKCYKLTPTGGYIPNEGAAPPNNNPIVVMITNLCPYNGNQQWCAPVGGFDQYGYAVHFDLRNAVGQITNLHWNNPEVTYQEVACSTGTSLTPTNAQYSTCICAGGTSGSSSSSSSGSSTTGGTVPSSFQWANGVNSWWVAFALNANSVSMNCGKGFSTLSKAGWTINGEPVWIWANTGYQCVSPVTVDYDGKSFSTALPF